ncbi:MAG: hypothetical protein V4440_14670 [Pseudomonadota bacterium]
MNKTQLKELLANSIIDALGGTYKTSIKCDVSMPVVSRWRRNGIPDGYLLYLSHKYPKVFKKLAELA